MSNEQGTERGNAYEEMHGLMDAFQDSLAVMNDIRSMANRVAKENEGLRSDLRNAFTRAETLNKQLTSTKEKYKTCLEYFNKIHDTAQIVEELQPKVEELNETMEQVKGYTTSILQVEENQKKMLQFGTQFKEDAHTVKRYLKDVKDQVNQLSQAGGGQAIMAKLTELEERISTDEESNTAAFQKIDQRITKLETSVQEQLAAMMSRIGGTDDGAGTDLADDDIPF